MGKGESTDEPLYVISADDPVICTTYAKVYNLLDTEGILGKHRSYSVIYCELVPILYWKGNAGEYVPDKTKILSETWDKGKPKI
jgi:hypothetical protein